MKEDEECTMLRQKLTRGDVKKIEEELEHRKVVVRKKAAADIAEGLYMRFLPDGTYNLILKLKKSFGGKCFYDEGKWTYSIVPDAENPAQGKILFDQNNRDACVGYYCNLSSQSFELLNRRDFNDTKFHKFKKKDVNINEDNTTHTLPELLD